MPTVKSKSVNAVKAVIVPPKEVDVPPIVIALFANSALATPASLIVTTPLLTAKLSEWNEATPLLEVLASSPAMVTALVPIVVLIPSPAVNVKVSPRATASLDPDSAAKVRVLFANSAFTTPPSLMVTAPLETAKLSPWKDATPLLEVVASSPEKVTVPEDSTTSIPSPTANVKVPPKAIGLVLEPSETVIVLLSNWELARLAILTAPEETVKSFVLNDATPLLETVASSAEKVTVPELSATSNPSPAANVAVPPNAIAVVLEPSETVIELLLRELFPILDNVLLEPLIVLLVNVSVVALPTIVSAVVGKVKLLLLFTIVAITGVVKTLFVKVSLPAIVAKVPVVGNVTFVVPLVVSVKA